MKEYIIPQIPIIATTLNIIISIINDKCCNSDSESVLDSDVVGSFDMFSDVLVNFGASDGLSAPVLDMFDEGKFDVGGFAVCVADIDGFDVGESDGIFVVDSVNTVGFVVVE